MYGVRAFDQSGLFAPAPKVDFGIHDYDIPRKVKFTEFYACFSARFPLCFFTFFQTKRVFLKHFKVGKQTVENS